MASNNVLVSLDIGNGYVKGRGPDGLSISYPSVVSVVSETLDGFDFQVSPNDDFVIGFDGKKWAVGETVYFKGLTPITIAHRSRINTDFYRVLFASALVELVRQPAVINLVISLPPAAYWDKEKQKNTLSGVYEVNMVDRGGRYKTFKYNVPIESIRVIPEGVGTICTMVLDGKGSEKADNRLAHSVTGVVDVGTYTCDLVQLDRLKIVRSGCDTLPHALHDIHDRLRTYAASEGYDLDMYKADEVLQRGYFTKSGRRHHIEDMRDVWAGELAQSVSAMIRTTWNGGDDVEAIIVTGGGAPYIERLLAMEFPHVRIIEDVEPFFANCEGGYRYGLLHQRVKGK
jgi:hypothetical protein